MHPSYSLLIIPIIFISYFLIFPLFQVIFSFNFYDKIVFFYYSALVCFFSLLLNPFQPSSTYSNLSFSSLPRFCLISFSISTLISVCLISIFFTLCVRFMKRCMPLLNPSHSTVLQFQKATVST